MENSSFNKFDKDVWDRKTKICGFLFHFFFVFTIVVLLLELFGVIDEAGIILGIIGVISTIYFGMITATNQGMGRIEKGIGRIEGRMGGEHKSMTEIIRDIAEILKTRK